MSGQSLTDVVSHVIQSMLDTPRTLMDELQLYVYQVDQTLPVDVSINEIYWLSDPRLRHLCPECEILQEVIREHRVDIVQYLHPRRGRVQREFAVSSSISLRTEYQAFHSFLFQYKDSTSRELEKIGITRSMRTLVSGQWMPVEERIHWMNVWHASREVAGRPDVQIGVWMDMWNVIKSIVFKFLVVRVHLTREEELEALEEAVEHKRVRLRAVQNVE
jgi:hypothetical protein